MEYNRRRRLGELLLETQLLEEPRLEEALRAQATTGERLGSLLVRKGYVGEEDILRCLSELLWIPWVDFRQVEVQHAVVKLFPAELAARHCVMPVALQHHFGKRTLVLAMADPTDLEAIRAVQFQLGIPVRPAVATESSILAAIEQHYGAAPQPCARERYRLHGWSAIEYAERFGGKLGVYDEQSARPVRSRLVAEAKRVARKDPGRVYLEAALCESCLAEGNLIAARSLEAGRDLWLCEECRSGGARPGTGPAADHAPCGD